jgi:hypothetical protein
MIRSSGRKPRQSNPLSIRDFKGIDVTGTRDVRRSPDMLNCILDDEGTPEMRTGYTKLYDTTLGTGPILGIHDWDGTEKLIHHGTKLYTYSGDGEAPVEVYDGLGGTNRSTAFRLADKLCMIDGTKFLIYDGATVTEATADAHVPVFLIGTPPGGGGTRVEDLNLINPRWWQKFSTVAGTTEYQLHQTVNEYSEPQPLDAVEEVFLNGDELTLTTDYTVDLTTGLLTLTANPGAGTNNLEVKVRDNDAVDPDRILKCTMAATYGGPSDSKVFLTGNPDYPHIDWWTGLPLSGAYDPTYWPDTNYDRIGGDIDHVVGYAVQYDRMIVFKRNSIYLRSWELTEDAYGRTVMRFPAVPLNTGEGAYTANSIQMVENSPYFLSDTGVYALLGSNVRDERNVEPMSTLAGIRSSGCGQAIDYKDHYYLALDDDTVWVADYRRMVLDESSNKYQPVWYKWDNMPVAVWCSDDDNLYFGSNTTGMVYRMKDKYDDLYPYNDDGALINTYFHTIFTTFDRDDMTKLIQAITVRQKAWSRSVISIEYVTENGPSGTVHTERRVLLDFADIDFSDFSFDTSRLPRAFRVRINQARNVQMFQLRLLGPTNPDEFFGFSSIDINYNYLSEVR